MNEEYRKGHAAGYASGIRDTQPNWISVAEHSPEKSDFYWAIGEFTEDYSEWKKGDLILETCTPYVEGIWPLEEIPIRILYWAEQPIVTPPHELLGRPLTREHWQPDHGLDFLDEEDETECTQSSGKTEIELSPAC